MADSMAPTLAQALRESEDRFRLMAESIPDGLTLFEDGEVVFVNNRLCEILGYTDAELARMGELELAAPEEKDRLLRTIRWVQGTGLPLEELRFWAVCKDGSRRYIRNRYYEDAQDEGDGRRLVVTSDITERELASRAQQESLERRGRMLKAGSEIAQELADVATVAELYRMLVALVKERFGYYHVQIFRPDAESRTVVLIEGFGRVGQRMRNEGYRLPYGRGVVGAAAATGEPVLASDLAQDSFWVPHVELPESKGELAVPIVLHDDVLAVLAVLSDSSGALTEDDQVSLLSLAGQVSVIVQVLRQLRGAQARVRRERVLREIAARMPGLADPDTLARAAVRELGKALGRPVLIRLGSAEELTKVPRELGGGDASRLVIGESGRQVKSLSEDAVTEGGE
jgi:PAS domain S-box-containing protein